MSQQLLLSLWVDPSRADRLGRRRGPASPAPVEGPSRQWAGGRWRAAFGRTPLPEPDLPGSTAPVDLPGQRSRPPARPVRTRTRT